MSELLPFIVGIGGLVLFMYFIGLSEKVDKDKDKPTRLGQILCLIAFIVLALWWWIITLPGSEAKKILGF